ncbi:PKD domain-containing protein [Filimonas lacunae]|nr:PKD domain-containing protein [Filimonas lacunae]
MQRVTAQAPDTALAQIQAQTEDNRVKLQAVLRPLRQVAGAPEAFYSYFWELGDGSFSFAKEPQHVYKDTGTYNIRLFATNNYDDGKKPRSLPRPVKVKTKTILAANTPATFFSGEGALEMKANCMPLPGEDMVVVLGYRNKKTSTPVNGSVMLLYNEKQFAQSSFDMADARTYHQERKIGMDSLWAYAGWQPDNGKEKAGLFTASAPYYEKPVARTQLMQALKQEINTFQTQNVYRVEQVQQQEERFMFLQLNTLPEMIKDTNAVVTITGLFIPDDPALEMERFNLELPIVASHDPNKMMLKNSRMNYRVTGKSRDIVYKVRFQNTGKGPAKKVAVTVVVPGMLNTGTVELVESKPACRWCDSAYAGGSCIDTIIHKDSVQFVFSNIYLPGTLQDGVNDPDSTMGYIKYKLHFGKGMVKRSFVSSASIVFDKNEPIYTNRSTGRFKKGVSPGVILGYGFLPGDKPDIGNRNTTLGVTLSEYAPYKRYWQWELFVQRQSSYEHFIARRDGGDTLIDNRDYKLIYRERYNKVRVATIEVVPLSLRYNFNSWLGAGTGVLVSATLHKTTRQMYRAVIDPATQGAPALADKEETSTTNSFDTWRGALFADVQVGRVRVGPSIGFRFLQYTNPAYQVLMAYASWKF